MKLSVIKMVAHGFKIKSKKDAELFLSEMIQNNGYYEILEYHHAIFIEKDATGNVTISEKFGNIFDIFNPEIVVAENNIDFVYQNRKKFNQRFFERC